MPLLGINLVAAGQVSWVCGWVLVHQAWVSEWQQGPVHPKTHRVEARGGHCHTDLGLAQWVPTQSSVARSGITL